MKKGSFPFQNLVVLVILIVFAGLFAFAFLAPKGLVNEAASQSGKIVNYIPWLKNDLPSADLDRDENMVTSYNKFVEVLEGNVNLEANDQTKACLKTFEWPKEFNGHEFDIQRNRQGEVLVQLRNARKQIVESKLIKKMDLCLVGGTISGQDVIAYDDTIIAKPDNSGAPKHLHPGSDSFTLGDNVKFAAYLFHTNWIKDFGESFNPLVSSSRLEGKRLFRPDYTLLEHVVIDGPTSMIIDSDKLGKEDGNLLYIPEAGKVCVFVTFPGDASCSATKDGLDNDCFISEEGDFFGEEVNLPYLIRTKKISICE